MLALSTHNAASAALAAGSSASNNTNTKRVTKVLRERLPRTANVEDFANSRNRIDRWPADANATSIGIEFLLLEQLPVTASARESSLNHRVV
jgi:hypothetical protein